MSGVRAAAGGSVSAAASTPELAPWAGLGRDLAERAGRGLGPLVVTLAIGAIVLAVTGRNPIAVYHLYLTQAAGSWPQLASTFAAATPLLLTGVGTSLAFRAGFFNVGLEGSVYLGDLRRPGWPRPSRPATRWS